MNKTKVCKNNINVDDQSLNNTAYYKAFGNWKWSNGYQIPP